MALGTVATRVLNTARTYCFVSSLSCSSHWSYAVLSTSCVPQCSVRKPREQPAQHRLPLVELGQP